jgi:hypothetical protein
VRINLPACRVSWLKVRLKQIGFVLVTNANPIVGHVNLNIIHIVLRLFGVHRYLNSLVVWVFDCIWKEVEQNLLDAYWVNQQVHVLAASQNIEFNAFHLRLTMQKFDCLYEQLHDRCWCKLGLKVIFLHKTVVEHVLDLRLEKHACVVNEQSWLMSVFAPRVA